MDKPPRSALVDFLRAVASQLIVLHHLAFYGPLSDTAHELASTGIDLLFEHGRYAVQVFFVLGGFGLAKRLLRQPPQSAKDVAGWFADRYRRIGFPYVAALLLVIVANETARSMMVHESISAPPTIGQFLAHLVLLHDVIGYEPLSAGIWYLAIDLQLFVLVVLVDWLFRRIGRGDQGARYARGFLLILATLSLFVFNREARYDNNAMYFLCSYALGLLVGWVEAGVVNRQLFWAFSLLLAGALMLEFRMRLVVAECCAILLYLSSRFAALRSFPRSALSSRLGKLSYSLFLIHFPVCLLVNAAWSRYLPTSPIIALMGMGVAYGLSNLAALGFYYYAERPLSSLGRARQGAKECRPEGQLA